LTVWSELCLTSETVEGATLALEGVDDIHGGDGLPLGVLGVGDGVTDDVLQEDLQDSTGLLVDEIRFTPPRRARRRMAGLVIPWMLSRNTFLWRLAPPLPSPLPPFPRPVMVVVVVVVVVGY